MTFFYIRNPNPIPKLNNYFTSSINKQKIRNVLREKS